MRCRGGASSADPPVTNIDEVAIATTCRYPADMLQPTLPAGFVAPCLPTKTDKLPSGGEWLHEIKHDGFRVIARKKGPQVRLYSHPGNDLTGGDSSAIRSTNDAVNTFSDRYPMCGAPRAS